MVTFMKNVCELDDVDIAKKYINTVVRRGNVSQRIELKNFLIEILQWENTIKK